MADALVNTVVAALVQSAECCFMFSSCYSSSSLTGCVLAVGVFWLPFFLADLFYTDGPDDFVVPVRKRDGKRRRWKRAVMYGGVWLTRAFLFLKLFIIIIIIIIAYYYGYNCVVDKDEMVASQKKTKIKAALFFEFLTTSVFFLVIYDDCYYYSLFLYYCHYYYGLFAAHHGHKCYCLYSVAVFLLKNCYWFFVLGSFGKKKEERKVANQENQWLEYRCHVFRFLLPSPSSLPLMYSAT